MKLRGILGFLCCAASLTLCWADCVVAQMRPLPQKQEVSDAIKVLDTWIEANVKSREESSLSIGIISDQDLVWAKSYGFADVQKKLPATPATLYRIGSISKVFTATAAMELRDAGKLQLDDPVEKRLSWFQIKEPQADSPPITIRDLLTHTSGLPRELPLPYWNDLKFPSREEMIRLVPGETAIYPPETKYKYSNLAFAIAGEVVAAVSGEPYIQYINNHILKPLNMNSTRVSPDANTPGLALGYRRRVPGEPREVEDFIDSRGLTPSAGFASSVDDLAKLVSLQFRGGQAKGSQILKGSTLREMQRVQWMRPDWQNALGLSFELRRVDEQVRVGKDGTVPGYQSLIEMVPAEKLGVIVLINDYDGDPFYYLNQAFTIVGAAITKANKRPEPEPVADPAWTKYVGTYTWKHADSEIMVVDGELTMITPDAKNPWESRVRLKPVGPNTFKIVGGGADGELLKFELDENGKAIKYTAGSTYRIRKR